jgi:hypothetical protein
MGRPTETADGRIEVDLDRKWIIFTHAPKTAYKGTRFHTIYERFMTYPKYFFGYTKGGLAHSLPHPGTAALRSVWFSRIKLRMIARVRRRPLADRRRSPQ